MDKKLYLICGYGLHEEEINLLKELSDTERDTIFSFLKDINRTTDCHMWKAYLIEEEFYFTLENEENKYDYPTIVYNSQNYHWSNEYEQYTLRDDLLQEIWTF